MDPVTKRNLRLMITMISTASFALSLLIVRTSGGSAATDCLSRWAVLLIFIVWLEFAFELGRRSDEVLCYDREEDPLAQASGSDPRLVKAPKWVRDEAAYVTWLVMGLVVLCLGLGLAVGGNTWNLNIPRWLTGYLHSGNDTLMLIASDGSMVKLAFMISIMALSGMLLGWLLVKVAEARPIAWQQAMSISETEAAWTFRGLALVGIVCLLFAGINMESYSRITREGMAIGRFPLPGENFQTWSSVQSIRKHVWTRTVRSSKGGTHEAGPFVKYSILFSDGSAWSSGEAELSDENSTIAKSVRPAINYVSTCSRRPIENIGSPEYY